MCRFCVQHGDGETWYLQAETYAADLETDLRRREFVIDFVQGFPAMRRRALMGARVLDVTPGPLAALVKERVNRRQQADHFGQPVPLEECERIFELASSIVRLPCVCRTAAGKPQAGYCLAITAAPADGTFAEAFRGYETGPDTAGFDRLTREQAMELLRECERGGLMHSVWTFISPFIGAICNCDLDSGCMAMKLTVGHDIKMMWRGEYVARLSAEECTGCGACVTRCPFGALDAPPSRHAPAGLRTADCWGCGVCRSACGTGALVLEPRAGVAAVAKAW